MKKSLLKTLIILMSVMLMCIGYVQAAVTNGYKFGINAYRKDSSNNKYVYTFQTTSGLKYIWNVQEYNNGIANEDQVFYCLAQGYGDFGSSFNSGATAGAYPDVSESSVISPSSYSGAYRLKDTGVQATLNSVYSGTNVTAFSGTNYNALLWIFDHMYIKGEEDRREFLNKIPCIDDANFTGMESFTVATAMETSSSTEDDVSDLDIEMVQQLAIWAITNPETVPSFPTIYLSINNSELQTYRSTYLGEDSNTGVQYGTLRNYCIKMIYNYLVNGAKSAMTSGYTGDTTTTILAYVNAVAQPVATISREKELSGKYNVVIKKVDEDGDALPGATFTVNGKDYITASDGTVKIADSVDITEANVGTNDTYSIVEKTAPAGYTKYTGTIGLTVSKKENTDGLSYIIDKATLDSTSAASGDVSINYDTNTITITVKNQSVKGQYTVKINKQNSGGGVLPGAVFTVNGTNYTTGTDGYATVANNVEINKDNVGTTDTYTIKEVTAPTGYLLYYETITLNVTKKLNGDTYVVNIATLDATSQASNRISLTTDGNVITITLIDYPIEGEYTVKINKQNDKGEILEGAKFTVNGTTHTTDSDGEAIIASYVEINKDNVGTTDIYTIKETAAPSGHILYSGTITLSVTKKLEGENYVVNTATLDSTSKNSGKVSINTQENLITITVVNKKIEGDYTVKIKKQNEDGKTLEGATFSVNESIYSTNASGIANIATNVEINKDNVGTTDTYTIKEMMAPTGYILYDKTIILSVTKKVDGENYIVDTATLDSTSAASDKVDITKEGNIITITIVDEKLKGNYTLKINKQNEEGEVLPGAVFTVNGTNYTTGTDGNTTIANNVEINKDNLAQTDTYTITEITAPSGYIKYDGTITVSVTKKYSGGTYVVNTATLDETSKASSDVDVVVNGNTITVTVIDKKIEGNYTVKLNKQNEDGEVLQGAVFTVNSKEYTTDASGNATIASNVEITKDNVGTTDTYTMKEIKAPDGYVLYNGTITLSVTKKQSGDNYTINKATLDETSKASGMVSVKIEGTTITVIIIEEKIEGNYTVKINKKGQDGTTLQGAVFKVNGSNYTTGTDGNVTIANNIEITKDSVGITDTYTITEVTAPNGYVKYNGTITLSVTKKVNGANYVVNTATLDATSEASSDVAVALNGNTITVTIVDKKIEGNYTVKINKQNENKEVLQGAVFTVNSKEYTTDASGNATIANNVEITKDNVAGTDTYTITEVTAPDGYIKYAETITLSVTKKVSGTNYVINTATLDSTSQSSNYVDVAISGNIITVTIIDKKIEGNYTVKINKQNEDGEVLQGAVFTVNSKEYTTDASGNATIASNVEITKDNVGTTDTYTMKEIKAPDGYVLYNGTITLSVTKKQSGDNYTINTATLDETSESSGMISVKIEGSTITVIIIEERMEGNYTVKINKKGKDGKVLQGAVFTVNGTNHTTDSTGYATVANNVEITKDNVGKTDTYTIKEVTAPNGYVKYSGTITLSVTKKSNGANYVINAATLDATSQGNSNVNIAVDGNVITVTVVDELIKGNYTVKIKKQNEKGEVLQNAAFTVNGTNYVTAADGYVVVADNIEITKDNVGTVDTYTIKEVLAPAGYLLYNGTITLEVTKGVKNEEYKVTSANLDNTSKATGKITASLDESTNIIVVTIIDEGIEKINISGIKTWVDYNNAAKLRPESITVNLLRNGTEIAEKVVTASDNWSYTFNNLDKTDSTGKEYIYTITEDPVENYTTKINGYDIINTYITSTSVEGIKTWVDYNNADKLRPESITVNLLRDGTKIAEKVVTASNNWLYTFADLEKYDSTGHEYVYTITENPVEHYTTRIDGYNITNTYTTNTSVSGIKTWVDYNNADKLRPESITVNLLRDGTEIAEKRVTANDNWSYKFDNLEKYDSTGHEYVYTITENPVENYTTEINGYNIINTYTITTSVSGVKAWVDYNNAEGLRPESITVNLLRDGTEIAEKTVTGNDNWSYTFDNLEKYDATGHEYVYIVTEDPVEYYTTKIEGYNITNTYTTSLSVSGTKIWVDYNNADKLRPESITVNLLRDGTEIAEKIVKVSDNWSYSFENLEKYDSTGHKYVYTITEDPVENYTTEINGYNIINTYTTSTSVSGAKTWVDYNNADKLRPESITVNLLRDGVEITEKVVTASDNWSYTFENLEKYDQTGHEYVYTVTEDPVENYETEINGYNITNTYTTSTRISGTKTWVDDNDRDEIRPESITVNLFRDGTKIDSTIVEPDQNGNWTYVFDNLEKYDSAGHKYEYTIEEEEVAGYKTKYEGYNIINTHITGRYTVKINKQNKDGEVLANAIFTVNGNEYPATDSNGNVIIVNDQKIQEDNLGEEKFVLEEIKAPDGYVVYDGKITLTITKGLLEGGKNYGMTKATLDETSEASNNAQVILDSENNTVTVIIVEENIDLALRKFISKVVNKDGKQVYSSMELVGRVPNADETNLKEGTNTTGEYNHTKQPLLVSVGDFVTYTLRVYNEGESNAYITEITDYLPDYLEYVDNGEWVRAYGTEEEKFTSKATTELAKVTGASENLQDQIGKVLKDGILLPAYDKENDKVSYVDVEITCEVLKPEFVKLGKAEHEITNIAEITGMKDRDGNEVEVDIDSTPDNVDLPETQEEWCDYQEEKIGKEDYIPGQQDDDDFEKILVKGDFDLALRKFITQVNEVNVDTRYPELSIDEDKNIKYTHPKNPIEVCYQDTVIYTIRVYNEGEVAGYANEITDDVPEGLEFIVDNEINKTYGWVMLDKNKEVTEDVSKAEYLVTDYLSEEQEAETGRDNLIQPFHRDSEISDTNPDYRDIQIAFKVTYQVTSPDEESRILVNVAQISEDSDDDIDSDPNRDEEYEENPEDDIDYDNVKVKYFDLSLLKWVTKAIIIEDGDTEIIETGHTGLEDPEPVVKVEIKSKNVNKVTVKFAYKIKITNEGEIAGYANEITDYIPQGLKFVPEDNPGWYEREDGVVATDLLKDTLLQPGKSAEVEIILTWINGEDNLGTKINIAEISRDENPSDTPDIDSTPDNEEPEEDDIDDAPVMLVIKTGLDIKPQYTILGMIVMIILATGTVAIKKFVL